MALVAGLVLFRTAFAEPTAIRWLKMPNGYDMASFWPLDRRVEAGVLMHCTIKTNGHLKDCAVVEEFPKNRGFGAATLNLSSIFLAAPIKEDGDITFPIIWRLPDRPRKEIALSGNPQWASIPSPSDITAAYPTATGNASKGVVTLRCFALESGDLVGCSTRSASPQKARFEDAALSLTSKFRVDPVWRSQLADLLQIEFQIVITQPDGVGQVTGPTQTK